MSGALSQLMERYRRFRRRRWVRRYALTVVRHSGIDWETAVAMANESLATAPGQLDPRDPTDPDDAAFEELGITEANLL